MLGDTHGLSAKLLEPGEKALVPSCLPGHRQGLGGREESQAQARGVADSLGRKQWVPGARDSCE